MILDSFGMLLGCKICGGEPYKYDMREYAGICSIECDICDLMEVAPTPEEVSILWNDRIYNRPIKQPI